MARERGVSVGNAYSGYGSFLPAKPPDVVKKMILVASKIHKDLFRKCLQVIIRDIEGQTISEDAYQALFETSQLDEENFTSMYAGLLLLLRYALRHPKGSLKKDAFVLELGELQFPKEFVEDIASIVFGERQVKIEQKQLESRLHLPTLTGFKWRIDVAISTSHFYPRNKNACTCGSLSRVLEPTVLMELKDSTGKVSSFEVTQSKFHELRYNIAFLLKEMEDLEKRSILKIE